MKVSDVICKWYIWAVVGYVIGIKLNDTLGGVAGLVIAGGIYKKIIVKRMIDNFQLCAQLRVCSQAGGIPVYPRFSQPDNSESWDDAGNGI